MNVCQRCERLYRAEKSTAELRLTWCSMMCQAGDGVSIRDLLSAERVPEGATKALIWRKMRAHIEREDAMLMQEAAG